VGDEEEYTLKKSFMESNAGGRNSGSPEVVATMERYGGEERKKERKKGGGGKKSSTELLCPEGRQPQWRPTVPQGG
jgi:hypothetical protein